MKAISILLTVSSILILAAPPAFAGLITEDEAAQAIGAMDQADGTAPSSAPTPSTLPSVCGSSTIQSHDFKWCWQQTDRTKNPAVIYFFHGLTMNEHRWETADFSAQLQATWKAKGLTPPTVISISFGPVWLLTQVRDDKYDLFVNQLMPYFEAMIGGPAVTPSQRIAMGESMGGFNVSQIFLKSPQLFSRFVMQCPAVTQSGPFDSMQVLRNFIDESGADPKRAVLTKVIGMYEMEDQANWLKHSPLLLASEAASFPTKVYLSCGNADAFGFWYGVDQLNTILQNKTQELQYVFIPGGQHGTVDVPSMANFVSADWSPTQPATQPVAQQVAP